MISIDLPDMAICTSPGFCAFPDGMFSVAHTMPMTFTFGFSSAMARIAPIIVAPAGHVVLHLLHAISGLDRDAACIESNSLPYQSQHWLSGAPAGSYVMTISAGGSSDPCATLQNAPIFISLILSAPYTSHFKPTSAHIFLARSARIVGVMRLEGSFTRSRVKFCDSPMICASFAAFSRAALVSAGDDGECVNLLILAVAAVIVGIEIPDMRAFDDGSHCFFRRDARRGDESEAADSAGLQGCAPPHLQCAADRSWRTFLALPPEISSRRLAFSGGLVKQIRFEMSFRKLRRSPADRPRRLAPRDRKSRFSARASCLSRRSGVRMVEDNGDQRFGFESAGVEREIVVFIFRENGGCFQYRRRTGKSASAAEGIVSFRPISSVSKQDRRASARPP